jgi:flagellin-like hook-associated protein FlgL
MSFGIKSNGGAEPVIKSQVDKNLRKAASGERINSAGEEAAEALAAAKKPAVEPAVQIDVQAKAPSALEPAQGSASVARAVLQDPDAAIKSSAQAADQIRARAQQAVVAQFNAPKAEALRLLA